MSEASTFEELIRRVRAGDQDAATELVRHYEPAIRRAVRFRLTDARLGRLLDSMDICQSVLKSFFVRAAAGQYELKTPQQLLGLLADMARKKLITQARRQYARRRGGGLVASGDEEAGHFVARDDSPSLAVSAADLLEEVRRRLSPDEGQLMGLRDQGHDWDTIAAQLGGTPDALRKRLTRALDRVARELGLDDEP
jgi:RNA polymerase sigma-70 factor (ECF subfamily)